MRVKPFGTRRHRGESVFMGYHLFKKIMKKKNWVGTSRSWIGSSNTMVGTTPSKPNIHLIPTISTLINPFECMQSNLQPSWTGY